MPNILETIAARKWAVAAVAGAGLAGWLLWSGDHPGIAESRDTALVAAVRGDAATPLAGASAVALGASAPGAAPGAGAPIVLTLGPEAREVAQQFRQLATLPAGDAAIALSRQLEAGISSANLTGYVDALLNLDGPAGDRTAVGALARVANSDVVQMLADAYGSLPAERRGRILQVLENAANPDAMAGLEAIVARQTDERGSPMGASALVGLAHLGTQPSIERLITHASGPNDAQALTALQRVTTRQGVELLRTAAAGGKGYEALTANQRATFGRVADAAAAAIPN
jgi:hypothetical protein